MIIIGEKINGAIPMVKEAIVSRNVEVIRQRAIAQQEAGAHFLDCAPSTAPEAEYDAMVWLIDAIQDVSELPICIDSPNAKLLARILEEQRLKKPGMVNSVNEESDKCETIFPLVAGTDWQGLFNYMRSQTEISEVLGISQASVSKKERGLKKYFRNFFEKGYKK